MCSATEPIPGFGHALEVSPGFSEISAVTTARCSDRFSSTLSRFRHRKRSERRLDQEHDKGNLSIDCRSPAPGFPSGLNAV